MNASHWHLILNHIPILGALFGALLLLIGIVLRNRSVEWTALITLCITALITVPTYLSGDEAEHIIEHMSHISEWELEEHEEHADLCLWLMMLNGVMALMSLMSYSLLPVATKWLKWLTFAFAVVSFLTMIPLAVHGGKITHPELREDAKVQIPDDD